MWDWVPADDSSALSSLIVCLSDFWKCSMLGGWSFLSIDIFEVNVVHLTTPTFFFPVSTMEHFLTFNTWHFLCSILNTIWVNEHCKLWLLWNWGCNLNLCVSKDKSSWHCCFPESWNNMLTILTFTQKYNDIYSGFFIIIVDIYAHIIWPMLKMVSSCWCAFWNMQKYELESGLLGHGSLSSVQCYLESTLKATPKCQTPND